ncbi:SGNH/GDSL hydrolase family protein [Stenotrophomonas maltophilia]|uniref:SGNH/GDSL hydrolase family protein n=1 Tax=Stenotrophomonas maltophilia TaxID=40324 RepID=A0AAI9FRL0_STEMA|nr:SGNH/GDSL hydrolase family protein [Stenotrophomonas maltophilia]
MARFSDKPQLQTLTSDVIIPGTSPNGGPALGGGAIPPGNDVRLSVAQLLTLVGDGAGGTPATRVGSLSKWNAAKARGATNPARLAIIGDSNVAGYGSGGGASGLEGAVSTGLARRLLTKKGVRSDCFFGDQNIASTSVSLPVYDPRISLGAGWAPDGTDSQVFGGRHIKGAATPAGRLRFSPSGSVNKFRVWYPTLTGLNQQVGVYIDGSLVDTINQNATASLVSKDYTVASGTHYIEFGATGAGDAFITGVETFDGTATPVALVGGYCGCRVADLAASAQPWNHDPMLQIIKPDFTVVICTINDTTAGTDPGAWYANMEKVVKGAAVTSDGCLCVGFVPSKNAALGGIYSYDSKMLALRSLAADYGWHFFDLRLAVGHSWARQSDRGFAFDSVHPNALGAEAIAEALHTFLAL